MCAQRESVSLFSLIIAHKTDEEEPEMTRWGRLEGINPDEVGSGIAQEQPADRWLTVIISAHRYDRRHTEDGLEMLDTQYKYG